MTKIVILVFFAFITFVDFSFLFQDNKGNLKQAPGHNLEIRYFNLDIVSLIRTL